MIRPYLGLVALALLLPAEARAADVNDCIDANEKAIALRKDHKLLEARAANSRCAATSCPDDLRRICSERAEKINQALPSILFDVKDGAGGDLTGVAITVDGEPSTADLTATALTLDPGPHTFTFTIPGQPTVTRMLVIREGEQARRERIVIGEATPEAGPLGGAPSMGPPAQPGWHVTFEAPEDGWSLVDLDSNQLLCNLPCTRLIERNERVELRHASPSGSVERVNVPTFRVYTDDQPILVRAKHSTGSVALDVTLLSVGGFASIIGVVFLAVGVSGTCTGGSPSNGTCPDGSSANHSLTGPGVVTTAIGLLGVGLGTALLLARTRGGVDLSAPARKTGDGFRIESVGPGWLTAVF